MRSLVVLFLLLAACRAPKTPESEIPPPNLVEPPTEEMARACASLEKNGCPEGHPRRGTCAEALARVRADGVPIPFSCLAAATTAEAIRACGDPSTLRVSCSLP